MITTLALLRARAGLTREAFEEYYEQHHVPLILRLAPPPGRYTRSYLPAAADRATPADFDVVTQLEFADEAALRAWRDQVAATPEIAEDEARFLDRGATRSWVVDTRG